MYVVLQQFISAFAAAPRQKQGQPAARPMRYPWGNKYRKYIDKELCGI
jgi:hypothetical protein